MNMTEFVSTPVYYQLLMQILCIVPFVGDCVVSMFGPIDFVPRSSSLQSTNLLGAHVAC